MIGYGYSRSTGPSALNAFNEALYDAATDGLLAADEDAAVSVVLLTGAGRAFSAGQDLHEMAQRATGDAAFRVGRVTASPGSSTL